MDMLDKVLRHRELYFEEIFEGKEVKTRICWFLLAILVLSGFYGLSMGATALSVDMNRGMMQMVSSALKVPLLYLLSIAVCYPVLYIVIVLMGSRLNFLQALTLILLALTLNSVLLASCAPIILFIIFAGWDYEFIKLLHVVIFAFSGAWAMQALSQGLTIMCEKWDLYPKQAIKILQLWILVFGLVGTQMAWSLRPFVGSPDMGFQLFRADQEGNFYKAVWFSVKNITSGSDHAEQ